MRKLLPQLTNRADRVVCFNVVLTLHDSIHTMTLTEIKVILKITLGYFTEKPITIYSLSICSKQTLLLAKLNYVIYIGQYQALFTLSLTTNRKALLRWSCLRSQFPQLTNTPRWFPKKISVRIRNARVGHAIKPFDL